MRKVAPSLIFGTILTAALQAAPAQAQATRTWVSGVGDDANPCSRTAPCKTFAGAISKTVAGGEINCLDPGGFGALTITRAITIDCGATFGSILAAGTNALNITNVPAGGKVIIRNLAINGAGTGLTGIRITTGAEVTVEKVSIFGFTNAGIDVAATALINVTVLDTNITEVPRGMRATTAAFTAVVVANNIRIYGATASGIEANLGAIFNVNNATISNSSGSAVLAASGGVINVENSQFSNNVITFNAGAGSTIRVSNNDVAETPTAFSSSGTIASASNNRIGTGAGAPNATIAIK